MLEIAGGIIIAVVVLFVLAYLLTEHTDGFIGCVATVLFVAMLAVGGLILRAILLP